ncbi:MAG: SDR family oxidoreductase [Candidatus Scalindua sp.]|nr:SDR family oxidoreductase [Candidatus Scalindua sp.]
MKVTRNRSGLISKSEGLFSLSGRVAVVTGAAGQLGGEYVQTLLAANARVAAFDIRLDNPKSKLGKIDSENLLLVEADITSRKSLQDGLGEVLSRFGPPAILVNNAAVDAPPNASEQETGPFETYPESSWQAIIDVNLTGMFLSCQVIGGAIARSGKGSIINISSIYGNLSPDQRLYEYKEEPFFKPVSYSVTKSGVLNLTRYLATYWAGAGVRVNTLTLGGVFNNQDETFLKNYCSKVPLGRMAGEGEYSGAVLFLASDASSYMTGANLIIDGGYSCW